MNEEDIKLCELAGLALGIPYKYNEAEMCFTWYDNEECILWCWDPLENSRDAFDLMVKLRMTVDTDYNGGVLAGNVVPSVWIEIIDNNIATATRRAIVTVAAEIGTYKQT